MCDYFCVNLFLAPKQAYTLFSKDYGNTTLKQFLKTRKIILPPSKTVTSIAFSKVEHGFTNMPSELESSVYTYKVKSKDDFQPNIILEIDVFEKENVYYVLRYGVTSELTPIR